MSELIKTIKCSNCGADIKIDLGNLLSYCPYCGTALMFDAEAIKEILIEREKTKQLEIKEEYRARRRNVDERLIYIVFISFALLFLFFFVAYLLGIE